MNAHDFEGTLILEKLAEIDKVDDFLEAIDSDDFGRVRKLLRRAGFSEETSSTVIRKIQEGDEE